jgi:tetratricopeptide (TPR) repeat protein
MEDLARVTVKDDASLGLAFYYRGLCSRKLGDHAGALEEFKALLALDKKSSTAWFEAGRSRFYTGDYAGAALDLRNAVELKEGIYGYHYALALALVRLGRYNEALFNADKVLELKNDYAPARALKGDIFFLMKNKAGAAEQYLMAAELAPENSAFYRSRAAVLEGTRPTAAPRKTGVRRQ